MVMHYTATLTPQTSLFLGRDRGNRVIRHSFHFIPSSTISGALNTYLHQIGRDDLMCSFRFSNFYPGMRENEGIFWLPSPKNIYYCPKCQTEKFIDDFSVSNLLTNIHCGSDGCSTLCRQHQGFVASRWSDRLTFNIFLGHPYRRIRIEEVDAQVIGRTAHSRLTMTKMEHLFYSVEVLKVRNTAFYGDLIIDDKVASILMKGPLCLNLGGQRSRGSGRAILSIEQGIGAENQINLTPSDPLSDQEEKSEDKQTDSRDKVLFAETPILPLGQNIDGSKAFTVQAVAPFAEISLCERWATKPLKEGKGLVVFTPVLSQGSVLKAQVNKNPNDLRDGMVFFKPTSDHLSLELHYADSQRCQKNDEISRDYTLRDLWSLGFGRLRFLQKEERQDG